jgi:hypothetical protein
MITVKICGCEVVQRYRKYCLLILCHRPLPIKLSVDQWFVVGVPRGFEFIHSVCSLSYDRFIACSKRVLQGMRSSASSFNFQYPLFSLTSVS